MDEAEGMEDCFSLLNPAPEDVQSAQLIIKQEGEFYSSAVDENIETAALVLEEGQQTEQVKYEGCTEQSPSFIKTEDPWTWADFSKPSCSREEALTAPQCSVPATDHHQTEGADQPLSLSLLKLMSEVTFPCSVMLDRAEIETYLRAKATSSNESPTSSEIKIQCELDDELLTTNYAHTLIVTNPSSQSSTTNKSPPNLIIDLQTKNVRRIFECNTCKTVFTDLNNLIDHLHKMHKSENYKCKICHQDFKRLDIFRFHECEGLILKCYNCGKIYKFGHALVCHIPVCIRTFGIVKKSYNINVTVNPHACPFCFKGYSSLFAHMKGCKNSPKKTVECSYPQNKYECAICNNILEERTYKNHVLICNEQLGIRKGYTPFDRLYFQVKKENENKEITESLTNDQNKKLTESTENLTNDKKNITFNDDDLIPFYCAKCKTVLKFAHENLIQTHIQYCQSESEDKHDSSKKQKKKQKKSPSVTVCDTMPQTSSLCSVSQSNVSDKDNLSLDFNPQGTICQQGNSCGVSTDHAIDKSINLQCTLCSVMFANTQILDEHSKICSINTPVVNTIPLNISSIEKQFKYSCNFCELSFKRELNVIEHVAGFHRIKKIPNLEIYTKVEMTSAEITTPLLGTINNEKQFDSVSVNSGETSNMVSLQPKKTTKSSKNKLVGKLEIKKHKNKKLTQSEKSTNCSKNNSVDNLGSKTSTNHPKKKSLAGKVYLNLHSVYLPELDRSPQFFPVQRPSVTYSNNAKKKKLTESNPYSANLTPSIETSGLVDIDLVSNMNCTTTYVPSYMFCEEVPEPVNVNSFEQVNQNIGNFEQVIVKNEFIDEWDTSTDNVTDVLQNNCENSMSERDIFSQVDIKIEPCQEGDLEHEENLEYGENLSNLEPEVIINHPEEFMEQNSSCSDNSLGFNAGLSLQPNMMYHASNDAGASSSSVSRPLGFVNERKAVNSTTKHCPLLFSSISRKVKSIIDTYCVKGGVGVYVHCNLCKRDLELKYFFPSHLLKHQKCTICEYSQDDNTELYRHIWHCHLRSVRMICENPFQLCFMCGKSFFTCNQRRYHQINIHCKN